MKLSFDYWLGLFFGMISYWSVFDASSEGLFISLIGYIVSLSFCYVLFSQDRGKDTQHEDKAL